MVSFFLLVAPLPTKLRRKALTFFSTSPVLAQVFLGLKFTFFFILILFLDSVNRVYRVQQEMSLAHDANGGAGGGMGRGVMASDRSETQVRRFYSQRNMYLCGFTLFLSHILSRTYSLVLELTEVKETLQEQKKLAATAGADSKLVENAELAKLKEVIRQQDLDIEHLKKQSDGLSKEYYKISDELNEKMGVPVGNKKTN